MVRQGCSASGHLAEVCCNSAAPLSSHQSKHTPKGTLLVVRSIIAFMHGDLTIDDAGDLARFIKKGREAKKVQSPSESCAYLHQTVEL